MHNRSELSPKILIISLLLLIGLPWSASHGATPVFADPNLACAGFTPCFATIQEAINNAGPGFSEVGVIQATYAESVDLSLMGSAIGEGPDSILIQALSPAGGAADNGVLIDPAALGGPGSGLGLTTGLMVPFQGDVFLSGLSITSPDTTALGVSIIGNLMASDLIVQNADSVGIAGLVDGNATLTRIDVSMNGASGISLSVTGSAIVNEVQALQNTGNGISLAVSENLTAQNVVASQNENGAQFFVCQDADIRDVTTRQNIATGMIISYGPDDCLPSGPVQIESILQNLVADPYVSSASVARGGATVGNLLAETIVSEGNGSAGIGISSSSGAAQLDGLFANDNLEVGLIIQSQQVELNDGEAIGNQTGMIVVADELSMMRIVANDSQGMPANPPSLGAGVFVAAENATLNDIQADNNPLAGLVLGQVMTGEVPSYTILDSQFDNNQIGILADTETLMGTTDPLNLYLDTIFLSDNQELGLSLDELHTASFSNVTVSGSEIGMDFTVGGQLQVETSSIMANATGMLVQIERDGFASVGCTNFMDNSIDGLEMIVGSTLAASANYWGDPSGPVHPGNPGGVGDRVLDGANGGVGTVNYSGFLSQPADDDDCPRGLPEATPVPVVGPSGMVLLLLGMLLILWYSKRRPRRV